MESGRAKPGDDNIEQAYISTYVELERLRRLSITDDLTGLYNRRYFYNRVFEEINRSHRSNNPFSLLILDVDHFKEINDTYGHLEGDRVLKCVAETLKSCVRKVDIVARYAGDEFVIILPDTEKDKSLITAEKILMQMNECSFMNEPYGENYTVGISIGAATYPVDGKEAGELISIADKGLYKAKANGRNRVCDGRIDSDVMTLPVLPSDMYAKDFVGRAGEMRKLEELFCAAQKGKTQLAVIIGETGVGKTRLVKEFHKKASSRGIVLFKGSSYETEISIPYQPFREALIDYIAHNGEEACRLITSMPDPVKVEIVKLIPTVTISNLGIPTALTLDPIQDEFRLFDGIYQLLKKMSEHKTLVLFLDDLHWADMATIELFKYIMHNSQRDRIVICVTLREDLFLSGRKQGGLGKALQTLGQSAHLERIEVGPLAKQETEGLIGSILGSPDFPSELAESVFRETDGNPLFVEELIKSLVENGSIKRDAAGWSIESDTVIKIPPSVKDVVSARLDLLDTEIQEVLVTGAVVGREFPFALLLAISGRNEGYLLDLLDQAVSAYLLEEDVVDGEDLYRFTHSSIREVLYGSLNDAKRRRCHRQVAASIELVYAERLESFFEALAYHYYEAQDLGKALTYFENCAAKERESYAYQSAVEYYEKVLRIANGLLKTVSKKEKDRYLVTYVSACIALGEVNTLMGTYNFALRNYSKALSLAPGNVAAKRKMGDVYIKQGEYQLALRHLNDAFKMADNPVEKAGIETARSMAYYRSSNFDLARDHAEKALELLKDQDACRELTTAYNNLGNAFHARGTYDKATYYYKESLLMSEALDDKVGIARAYNNLGSVSYSQGDNEGAAEYYKKYLDISTEVGDKSSIARAYNNLGTVSYSIGDDRQAAEYFEKSLEISQGIGDKSNIASALNNLGTIYFNLSEIKKAKIYTVRALQLNEEIGNRTGAARAYNNLGNVCFSSNQFKDALASYSKSLAISSSIKDRLQMASSCSYLGAIYLRFGMAKKAARCFHKSLELSKKLEDNYGIARTYIDFGRLVYYEGKDENAESYFRRAIKIAHDSGASDLVLEGSCYLLVCIASRKESKDVTSLCKGIRTTVLDKKSSDDVVALAHLALGKALAFQQASAQDVYPHFDKAIDIRQKKKQAFELGEVFYEYALAARAMGDREKAISLKQMAEEIFQKIGARLLLKKCTAW